MTECSKETRDHLTKLAEPYLSPGDAASPSFGMTIGIVDSEKGIADVLYLGAVQYPDQDAPTTPDDSTLWEIGSVTKTLTATLLANAVSEGLRSLGDAAYPYFSQAKQFPQPPTGPTSSWQNLETLTLEQLGNYTSGLPDVPSPSPTTVEIMFQDLLTTKIGTPGEYYVYSDLGFALLAYSLAPEGTSAYVDLLQQTVLTPLGMTSSSIYGQGNQRNLPIGYDYSGGEASAKNSRWPAFDGAGALLTTGPDYLKWLQYNMGQPGQGELGGALSILRSATTDAPSPGKSQKHTVSLAWAMNSNEAMPGSPVIYSKNGGVPAFSSFVTYAGDNPDAAAQLGVFVSMNRATRNNPHLNPSQELGQAILGYLLGGAGSAGESPSLP